MKQEEESLIQLILFGSISKKKKFQKKKKKKKKFQKKKKKKKKQTNKMLSQQFREFLNSLNFTTCLVLGLTILIYIFSWIWPTSLITFCFLPSKICHFEGFSFHFIFL